MIALSVTSTISLPLAGSRPGSDCPKCSASSAFCRFLAEKLIATHRSKPAQIHAFDCASALVGDVIMPLVSLILPNGEWRKAAITLRELPPDGPDGDVRLMLGDLSSVVVDFMIVGFVLFLLVRAITRIEKMHPHEPTNLQRL